jgi:hypothetical protein
MSSLRPIHWYHSRAALTYCIWPVSPFNYMPLANLRWTRIIEVMYIICLWEIMILCNRKILGV